MKPHPFTPGTLIVNWRTVLLVIEEIAEPRDGVAVVLAVGENGELQEDWLFVDSWKVVG